MNREEMLLNQESFSLIELIGYPMSYDNYLENKDQIDQFLEIIKSEPIFDEYESWLNLGRSTEVSEGIIHFDNRIVCGLGCIIIEDSKRFQKFRDYKPRKKSCNVLMKKGR